MFQKEISSGKESKIKNKINKQNKKIKDGGSLVLVLLARKLIK